MNDSEVEYRGCKIYKGLDHRGRTQWWISIPRPQGTLQYACNSVEDGKSAIDEHLAGADSNRRDMLVPVSLVLLLAGLVAAFFGAGV